MEDPAQPSEQPPDTSGLGKVMVICAWILAVLLMTLFFSHWNKENQMNTKARMVTVNGSPEVFIKRNAHNQYMVDGLINGTPVVFLLDTGATSVVIPENIAKKLNLVHGAEGTASTAGGNIKVYLTRVDEIVIGNITLHHVAASVNPSTEDDEVLLGMSALRKLTIYQQGDNLVLTVPKDNE